MALRRKTLLLFSATLVAMLVVLFAVSRIIVLSGFSELENKDAQVNIERVVNAISNDIDNISSITADWAYWDDTYFFVRGENDEYIEVNHTDATYVNLDLNLMAFLDASNQLVYAKNMDLVEGVDTPISQALLSDHLVSGSPILDKVGDLDVVKGSILLPEGLLLFASRNVLDSDQSGPIAGTVVMGRFLDSGKVEGLAEQTKLDLDLYPLDGTSIPEDVQMAQSSISGDSSVFVQSLDSEFIAGYAVLKDINGQPAMIMKATLPRNIYSQGLSTISYFMLSLLGIGVVFGLVALVALDRAVLSRLARLSADVIGVGRGEAASARVRVAGTDELSGLGNEINHMLGAIEDKTNQVTEANSQLEAANKELEAFSYSVSHGLRAPLGSIQGFSQALVEDYTDNLDEDGQDYLTRLVSASGRMGELIDDMLDLSRVAKGEMERGPVDISEIARSVTDNLQETNPGHHVKFLIEDGLRTEGDAKLIKAMMENLLGNAWKYSGKVAEPCIEIGTTKNNGNSEFFVRDNGAGFEMAYAEKLFTPFQRLHSSEEFEGTGIGLATVQRIVNRHGGTIRAEAEIGKGATFYFTI